MIKTISIREINQSLEEGYEIYIITRYLTNSESFLKNPKIKWVKELSPSTKLYKTVQELKNANQWTKDVFDTYFVPSFIKETTQQEFRNGLNKIFVQSKTKNIALACYCEDESMCHRSIVLGLLQAVGCKTEGKNYSPYWLIHKMMMNGTYDIPIIKPEIQKTVIEQQKIF